MKKWMKQCSRILVLVLAAVCLFTCLTVTAYAAQGWNQDSGGWWYVYDSSGNYYTSCWKQIDGSWYYFGSDGYCYTGGWKLVGSGWYYFASGGQLLTQYNSSTNGWICEDKSKNVYFYVTTTGSPPTLGKMQTGWVTVSGTKYYLSDGSFSGYQTGQMLHSGWHLIGDKYYYMATNGAMQTGWITLSSGTYYLGTDGVMCTGWQTINGSKYYFDSSGAMLTGWQTISGSTYYFNSSGVMLTGIQTNIGGEIYKFGSDGKQYTSGGWSDGYYFYAGTKTGGKAYKSAWTPDGKYVGSNGKVYTGYAAQNGTTYYVVNGVKATGTYTASDGTFYFSGGLKYTGWVGETYYSGGLKYTGYAAQNGTTYYVVNGTKATGTYTASDGTFYFSGGLKYTGWANNVYYIAGVKASGWVTISGDGTYYFDSGVKRTGVQTISSEIYYFDANGRQYTSGGWQGAYYYYSGTQYNGRAYRNAWTPDDTYVGSDGKVYTGYATQNSTDYYVVSGKKATGEYYDGTGTFYFKTGLKYTGWEGNSYYVDGVKQTGWQKIGDYWYYLGTDGVMWSNGWKEIGGKYYYLNADGVLLQGNDKGWLQIGSDWYMLKTTGYSTPAEGLYSRMTGWVTINSVEYYLDPDNNGIMATSAWVPSTNDATDRTAYVDASGARVYDDWVEDYNYYIDANGIMHIGWKEYDGKWYHFGYDGEKDVGWSEQDGIWYYLDPDSSPITGAMVTGLKEIEGNKYYFYDENSGYTEGSMATNTYVLDDTYYATDQGILIPVEDFHYAINPYFDYVPGGLYGTPSNPAQQTLVTEAYETNLDADIPTDYAQLSLGAHPAASVDLTLPNTVTRADAGWGSGHNWAWEYAEDQVVDASVANRSSINGNMSALYHSVATLNGVGVDLKITVVDYSVVAGKGETPVIAFNTQGGIPGVMGLNLSWVQLKYELFNADTGELLPADTKGNTTYYDIDAYQSVCFNDSTNHGIYSREICELYTGTVTGHGILDGPCVFLNSEKEFDEAEEMYEGGVTEIFEGNTLIRTFSFKNGSTSEDYVWNPDYYMGTAAGVILNDGHPVASGSLFISNTVSPDNGEPFEFTIHLTNAPDLDAVFDGLEFVDGKATVFLKHGESVTVSGIPSGLTYSVVETEQDGYVCQSSGASGSIIKDGTARAIFKNVKTFVLTVTKTVAGDLAPAGKEFVITVHYTEPGDDYEKTVDLTLKHLESETVTLPYGTTYYVTEDYSAEGYSTEGTFSAEAQKTLTADDSVNIVNTLQTRVLRVEKTVDGSDDAMNTQFSFTLNVWYAKGNGETEATKFLSETFTLSDGEHKEFTLPKNATYTVEETPAEGFDTAVTDTGNGVLTDNAKVTFENTQMLTLTVKKQVVGETADTSRKFELAVSYTVPGGTEVTQNISLAHTDEPVTFKLPYGTTYTVTEPNVPAGYTASGTVETAAALTADAEVTVVNTASEHKLTVKKTVVGNAAAQAEDFTFTLSVVPSGGNADEPEVRTFTLKHGQTAEFVLPALCSYTVTETDPGDGYLTPVVSGNASVNEMTQDETVEFTNTQLISLTLKKQVSGNMGSKTQAFSFTVKLTANGAGLDAHSITSSDDAVVEEAGNDGEYTVTLIHGAYAVFTVPYGTEYVFTEDDACAADGYKTEITGAGSTNGYTATGTAEENTEVTYKNSKGFAVPTGVSLSVLPFLGMVFFGTGLAALQILGTSRKSRRGR